MAETNFDSVAGSLNSKITTHKENLSSYLKSIETNADAYISSVGNMRTITFKGNSRSHDEDEILFTLPSNHRPNENIYFTGNVGAVAVTLTINSGNGNCYLFSKNNAGTGRIYFSVAFAVYS